MAAGQLAHLVLILRYRGQAPSHILTARYLEGSGVSRSIIWPTSMTPSSLS